MLAVLPESVSHDSTEDKRYALGLAYNGLLDRIEFNIQRRINLANGVGDQSIKGLGVWIAIFAGAKSIPPDMYPKAIPVLEAVSTVIPVFGLLLCLVYMGIARSVYQDEINYLIQALKYEEGIGFYGSANTRYLEIVDASYWRPSTTDLAGAMWFTVWLAVALVTRYYTL